MRRKVLLQKNEGIKPIGILPLVEIAGDKRILVEQHRGVLGYDKETIRIKLPLGLLLVKGCNLKIIHMSRTQLVITGRIICVEIKRSVS